MLRVAGRRLACAPLRAGLARRQKQTIAEIAAERYSADPNITMQDLVDSYMAPFQACVEKGKVSSLMCSYNAGERETSFQIAGQP